MASARVIARHEGLLNVAGKAADDGAACRTRDDEARWVKLGPWCDKAWFETEARLKIVRLGLEVRLGQ
jgi:hypothetical protein